MNEELHVIIEPSAYNGNPQAQHLVVNGEVLPLNQPIKITRGLKENIDMLRTCVTKLAKDCNPYQVIEIMKSKEPAEFISYEEAEELISMSMKGNDDIRFPSISWNKEYTIGIV